MSSSSKAFKDELSRLFEEARAGSSQALERLIGILRPIVYRKAKDFVDERQPGVGPSTLTQEVSYGLSKAVRRARQSGSRTLMTLVNTLVRNEGVSAYRHTSRHMPDSRRHVPLEDVASQFIDEQESPDEQLERKQRAHRLLVDMAQLRKRQRLALEGTLAGKSPEELAAQLGCNEAAVGNLLQRAKQKLQHTDETSPPGRLTAALLSCLQRRSAGAQLDPSLLARDYPEHHETLRDFLVWLEEVRRVWSATTTD